MSLAKVLARLGGIAGGLLSAFAPARAVELPKDHAEAMFHLYDGGGTRASGPALLVRKNIADTVAVTGQYFVDMVSNASIDVVTQASPYHETRNEYSLSADYVVRDAKITLSSDTSREPDYKAQTFGADLTQETFGGMTTVALGFGYGNDKVGKHTDPSFSDTARHWSYRAGVTQILTPRWLASANFEANDDDGYLASPYRAARAFGAFVPERDPRTRAAQAYQFRVVGDIGEGEQRQSIHASWRLYRDTWGIHGNTFELGTARYFANGWQGEAFLRWHQQQHALFYSDNATAETEYLTRNRQLASFHDLGLGFGTSRIVASQPGRYEVTLRANVEFMRFSYSDFTDVRSGRAYSNNAGLAQVMLSANF